MKPLPNLSIIAALAENRVIGRDNRLPWRLPADLAHFKRLTMGKPIVMGRLTHESIGKPLPGRQNIVITRQQDYVADGCDVVASPQAAIEAAGNAEEIMIIGGGEIYRAFLPLADRIHMTRIAAHIDGDAFFPVPDPNEWQLSGQEKRFADAANDFDVTFLTLDRKTTD